MSEFCKLTSISVPLYLCRTSATLPKQKIHCASFWPLTSRLACVLTASLCPCASSAWGHCSAFVWISDTCLSVFVCAHWQFEVARCRPALTPEFFKQLDTMIGQVSLQSRHSLTCWRWWLWWVLVVLEVLLLMYSVWNGPCHLLTYCSATGALCSIAC
jgi:hypothetical protein